ncbi:MAG TPA: hypothetical protein VMT15_01070 [Bryobacteraceae bacterium]|nr:hypothetical protein [Bryobacteraceae bacterium]
MFRRPIVLAALATAVLWLCQFSAVRVLYGGNWTGLFCISPSMPVPEFLRSERLYLFQGSPGYDGQLFHLIAHDPWMRRGSAQAIGGAKFRYQRILVPALAWMLAMGRDEWVHAAYFAVILGFTFLGVFWLARWAQTRALHPAWGLAFLAIPATITSADRMTADVALAALAVGFALYAGSSPIWITTVIAAAAILTRETGGLIVAGYAIYLLSRRQFARLIATGCAFLPASAWFLYVNQGRLRSQAIHYLDWIPLKGLLDRIIRPAVYPMGGWRGEAAILFDFFALAGVVLLLAAIAKLALAHDWDAVSAAIFAFALTTIFLSSRDVWEDAYNFGRVLSPLLLLVFIKELPVRPLAALAPMTLIDLRIGLNIGHELEEILRGLLK